MGEGPIVLVMTGTQMAPGPRLVAASRRAVEGRGLWMSNRRPPWASGVADSLAAETMLLMTLISIGGESVVLRSPTSRASSVQIPNGGLVQVKLNGGPLELEPSRVVPE